MDYGDLGMDPEVLRVKAAAANGNGTAQKGDSSANGHAVSPVHALAGAALKTSAKITSVASKLDTPHAVLDGVSA